MFKQHHEEVNSWKKNDEITRAMLAKDLRTFGKKNLMKLIPYCAKYSEQSSINV